MMDKSKNYTTVLDVAQSAAEVFKAIVNVRGWWQGDIQGKTEAAGDAFSYRMGDVHFSIQKVTEIVPGRKLVWLVTESKLSFVKNENEWTGTTIIFEITPNYNGTRLTFTHSGLVPGIECYGGCSGAWKQLVGVSLRSLITTGKGVDVFS